MIEYCLAFKDPADDMTTFTVDSVWRRKHFQDGVVRPSLLDLALQTL